MIVNINRHDYMDKNKLHEYRNYLSGKWVKHNCSLGKERIKNVFINKDSQTICFSVYNRSDSVVCIGHITQIFDNISCKSCSRTDLVI